MKLSEDVILKIAVWAVAFAGIVVLIAMDKIPASSIQYVLFWLAGAAGGKIGLTTAPPVLPTDGSSDGK